MVSGVAWPKKKPTVTTAQRLQCKDQQQIWRHYTSHYAIQSPPSFSIEPWPCRRIASQRWSMILVQTSRAETGPETAETAVQCNLCRKIAVLRWIFRHPGWRSLDLWHDHATFTARSLLKSWLTDLVEAERRRATELHAEDIVGWSEADWVNWCKLSMRCWWCWVIMSERQGLRHIRMICWVISDCRLEFMSQK
jgi:hypothetical protein